MTGTANPSDSSSASPANTTTTFSFNNSTATTFSLTYAGVALLLATEEILAKIDATLGNGYLNQTDSVSANQASIVNTSAWGPLPKASLPRGRPGFIHWPVRADKFACAWFLCSSAQWSEIETNTQLHTTPQAQPLLLNDGTHSLSLSMYLANAQPLYPGLYLLTLVDQRYFAQQHSAGLAVPSSISWTALLQQLMQNLSWTGTIDTIPSAYGNASTVWNNTQISQSYLLAAATCACGLRTVALLDGTFACQNSTNAVAAQNQLIATLFPANNSPPYPIITGGYLDWYTVFARFPAEFTAIFNTQTVPVSLSSLSSSFAWTGINLPQGIPGNVAFYADAAGTPTNGQNALASQAALDWYTWQLGNLNIVLAGIIPIQPNGLIQAIDWYWQWDRVATHVYSSPETESTWSLSPLANNSNLAITVSNGQTVFNNMNYLNFLPAEAISLTNPANSQIVDIQFQDAGPNNRGLVSELAQTWSGTKTLYDGIIWGNGIISPQGAMGIGGSTVWCSGQSGNLNNWLTAQFNNPGSTVQVQEGIVIADGYGQETQFPWDPTPSGGVAGYTGLPISDGNTNTYFYFYSTNPAQIVAASANQAAYCLLIAGTKYIGQQAVISYQKPGGGSGTMTFTGGILTAFT